MLSVVLTILKIIGFILLGIIALVLLIVLAVLFVPVRYRAAGEADIPEIQARGRVSWLLHIVHVSFIYDDSGGVLRIRIFGIPVKKKAIEKPADKEKDDRSLSDKLIDKVRDKIRMPESAAESDNTQFSTDTADDESADGSERTEDNNAEEPEEQKKTWEYSAYVSEPAGKKHYSDVKPPKRSFFQKIGDSIRRIGIRIKDLLQTAGDMLKQFRDKKDEVMGYIEDPQYQEAVKLVFSELIRLLGHYRPRKIRGDLELGLDDPSATGMILGAYYALYPVDGKYFRFTGNFEHKVIRGHGMLRGHIRIIHLAVTLLRLYRNSTIKGLLDRRKSDRK